MEYEVQPFKHDFSYLSEEELHEIIYACRDGLKGKYEETYDDYTRSENPRMISDMGWMGLHIRSMYCDFVYMYQAMDELNKRGKPFHW